MAEDPDQDRSPISFTSKIPLVQGTVHIPSNSFTLEDSSLEFICNSMITTTIICKFFVFENGLGFDPDINYNIPTQRYMLDEGIASKIRVMLNINEYSYEYTNSLPIVIEACNNDMIEITILEIRNKTPKILQQRIIKNKFMYELKEIFNPPDANLDDRDTFCVICMTFVRNTIIEPCCHICLCEKCASLMRTQIDRKCPMCRKGNFYLEVTSFIKVALT